MEKQFVTYEIALKLKKLGFSEECLGIYYYDDSFKRYILEYKNTEEYLVYIPAPLWQQVIDWLREKYDIHIEIQSPDYPLEIDFNWTIHKIQKFGAFHDGFADYNGAREQAILKALSMLEVTT